MVFKMYSNVIIKNGDDIVYRGHNNIVNLGVLVSLARGVSTPSSMQIPTIIVNSRYTFTTANYTITQVSDTQYTFTYTWSLSSSYSITSIDFYPYPLSYMTQRLGTITLTTPITGDTVIWSLTIQDPSGILFSILPYNVIASATYKFVTFGYDGNTYLSNGVQISIPNDNEGCIFSTLLDSSTYVGKISNFYGLFLPYYSPTGTSVSSNQYGLQLVPASGSQVVSVWWLWNSPSFEFEFTFTSGSSPLADGFAVTLYSSTPPQHYGISGATGMVNTDAVYGNGNQIVAEFDPYASQPISITWVASSGFKQQLVSSSGIGSGTTMTSGHTYLMSIIYSNGTLTVTVTDTTTNTTVASQSVTMPFTPPSIYYVMITARNVNDYANWTLTNLQNYMPYVISSSLDIEKIGNLIIPVSVCYTSPY